MPQLWSFTQLIEYNFHQVASVLFRKYPNPYATHVVSVDVISRSIDPETGVLRTERLIGVRQPAPRWVSAVGKGWYLIFCVDGIADGFVVVSGQLMGTTAESYAREVAFVIPSTSTASDTSPPQVLLSSINMSLKNILTCHERISYTASISQPESRTEMVTIAEISAQGTLKKGVAAKRIGKKFEEYSMNT